MVLSNGSIAITSGVDAVRYDGTLITGLTQIAQHNSYIWQNSSRIWCDYMFQDRSCGQEGEGGVLVTVKETSKWSWLKFQGQGAHVQSTSVQATTASFSPILGRFQQFEALSCSQQISLKASVAGKPEQVIVGRAREEVGNVR